MNRKLEIERVAQALLSRDRILVACHQNPDGDALGSAWSLAWALRKLGKQARAFCADTPGEEYAYFTQLEQPSFEPEFFVTVDVASPELLGKVPFRDRVDLVLDHHRTNVMEAKQKFVDPESASCGEIVLEVIQALGAGLDEYLATALYTAISTDTGCFRYSNVTEKTFLAAARLFPFAPKGAFYRINKRLFETKSRKKLDLEAWAIKNVELSSQGRIAYLAVDLSLQKEFGVGLGDLEGLINVIRQIQGVVVSIVVKEKEPGLFKASVRSEEEFDASGFCAVFGGGGHRAAAGASFTEPESVIREKLLAEAARRLS